MALPYLQLIPASDQIAFERSLRAMAARLGGQPDWYAITMYRESQMKPTARNPSGATGIIQFMPATARGLGTSTDALYRMSALEQLPFVETYYRMQIKSVGKKPASLVDVYLLTLYPKAVGKPSSYVVFRQGTTAHRQNQGIKPGGGDITVADIAVFVNKAIPANYVAAATGGLVALVTAGLLIFLTNKYLLT